MLKMLKLSTYKLKVLKILPTFLIKEQNSSFMETFLFFYEFFFN